MSDSVSYKKFSDKASAFAHVKENFNKQSLAKYKVQPDLSFNESDYQVLAEGKGYTITLDFTDSQVEIGMKLSLLVRPMKGKILDLLQKELGTIL